MKVKRTETVKYLKVMLSEKEGISEDHQLLSRNDHGGFPLYASESIMDCGIVNNCTIRLKEFSWKKLYFKTPPNEKTIELEVKTSTSFHWIKPIIQETEGIRSDDYSLYYAGNLISYLRTVASLHIEGK